MGHGRCVEEIRHLAARMHSYPTSSLTVFAPVTTVPGMRLGLQWGPGRVLDGPRKDGQRGGGKRKVTRDGKTYCFCVAIGFGQSGDGWR